ncbi:MAG: hypothetical protein N4A49_07710 [Marinifilaceae bacterium]|jgi:hypothetical protein|nr:hypothetical protein [Marinifilaceae bacterium]
MKNSVNKLPQKCVKLKAAYLPATKWWCKFCGPTGGNVCFPVCLMIGKTKNN